ncbi:unnamed protein product [Paramecium octaurelia]|uniref:EGF-like domain-containing protein n=1 Tax=Paramecium octaurelia TaxID=43137 RepID=A0A8S1S0F6_PAROT|nr:unnamed protein product [Paramecium octaurelia]
MNNRSTIFIAFLLKVYTAKFDNRLTRARNAQEIGTQCQLNQFLLGNICQGKHDYNSDCHYSCQQCIGNQVDSCTSCDILTKRMLNDNKCACLESYYELEPQTTCQKCNKSCLTCQGGSESDCLSCDNKSTFVNNRCICKAGYFIDNNMECTQCDFTCEYCFNSSFNGCIKCNPSSLRYLDNNECKCPTGYYSQAGMQQCQKCNDMCNTCDSQNSCLSCKEDTILLLNSCVCQTGYVLIKVGNLSSCQNCHNQCESCFGIYSYQCSTCKLNSTLQSDNTCHCDDGYYLSQNDCQICDSSCLTCVYTSTNCLSCQFGYTLESNNKCCHGSNIFQNNQCQCSDEFYLDSSGICNRCPYNCLKCDENFVCSECIDKLFIGTSCDQNCLPVNCQECDLDGICTKCMPNYQKDSIGDCVCNAGQYYLDLLTPQCLKCSEQFDKCQQCDATGCFVCEEDYFLDSGPCTQCMPNCKSCSILSICDVCYDGYFDNQCDKCHPSCKNCRGSQKNQCLECFDDRISNIIIIFGDGTSQVECQCNSIQQYYDGDFNCQNCDTKCNTCDGGSSSHCLDCFLSQNRVLVSKSCLCDQLNNYADLGDDQCYLMYCGYGCADCQYIGLVYTCQSCHSGLTNRINDPVTNCPCQDGYYEVSKKSCKQCPKQCGTCDLDLSNQPYCTTCAANRDANDNCKCLIGYYQNGPYCDKCPETCLYCLAINNCVQCQPNFFLKDGTCVCPLKNFYYRQSCSCLQGYYMHLENQKCLPCHPKCEQCEFTSTNCIKCSDHYYNPPDCICASGLYELDIKCVPCTNNCHLCKSDSECLDCPSQLTLIQNQCKCQTGYFNYPGSQDCNQCSLQCLECNYHQDNCVTCKFNRVSPQLCTCPDGTYEIDLVSPCLNCNSVCITCELNSSNCLKCTQNRADPPLCKCKVGYFEDNDQICQQCNARCGVCETSSENCITCKLASSVPPTCDCLDGYFNDISNGCIKCHKTCLTCNGSEDYNCLTCDTARFMQLQNTKCECLKNYYYQDDNCYVCSIEVEVCQPKICGDGIKSSNEQCDDGNTSNRDGCSRDCKQEMEYYCELIPNLLIHSSIYISTCTKCSQYCKVCNSSRCLQCNSGYFLTKSFECSKCDKHCKECSGPFQKDCLSCIKGIDYGFTQKCAFCEETIGLYTKGLQCASLCGDGIRKSDEQCDDGNTFNNDGCSSTCQIEQDWGCKQQINTLSVCYKLNLSIASLEFERVKDFYQSSRFGLISFSKPMILINSSIIKSWKQEIVDQIDHVDYDINSTSNYNQDGHLESISIKLLLHKSIDFVQYQINFTNYVIYDAIDKYPLKSSILKTELLKYKQLSTQTLSTTKASRQFGSTVLFILGGIALIGLLMGSLDFYWNVLDNLQILSYITYINVNFPYMHNQFLDIFQFARFEFTNDFFKFDIINGLDYHQNKDYPLIVERNVEYNLVVNLSSILVFWVTPFILLFISKFNLFIIQRLLINKFQSIKLNQKVNSLKFLGYKVVSFIHFISLKYCSNFYYNIILRVYLSSLYDLNFSIFTSAYCWLWNQNPNFVEQVSFLGAMSLLLFQLVVLFILSTSLKASSYQIASKHYAQHFGSLYEGIKSVKQINRQIQFLQPLRKILFMGALLLFFDTAIYQISLLISIQILSSIVLITLNPYMNFLETIKGITQDVGLSLSLSLILFYYAQDQFQITDQDTIEKLSYIHVGIYTIMLSTSLVIDLYQQFRIISNKYKYLQRITQVCQKKKPENQPSNRDMFIDLSQENGIKLQNNQFCFTNLRIQ